MNPEPRFTFVSLSSGTILRTILFLAFFAVLFIVRDLVLVVLAAVVLASSIEPATLWFAKYKVKRLPAVIIVYLALASIIVGFFLFFLPSLLTEVAAYLSNLPSTIDLSTLWNPSSSETDLAMMRTSSMSVQDMGSTMLSVGEILTNIRDIVSGGGEGAIKTASIFFGGALSFVLILVLSFYLAVQEDGVASFLRLVTPLKQQEYIVDLWKRSQKKIGYWMQGQVLLGFLVGLLVYLGLMVLGVKHALLLATLAAFFELIPIFGPVLAAIPALIIASIDGGISMAIFVFGLYVIIHQFENHLLYPYVVKKIVGVSPIVVILALVVGAKLAGFLGALLAVPLAAALMEYVNDVEKRKAMLQAN